MTPSWYDVLGLGPDASDEEVRAAFRSTIADLDPTDRRFKLASRAAEVLLDPERRASYDADLAAADDADDVDNDAADAEDDARTTDPAGSVDLTKPAPAPPVPVVSHTPRERRGPALGPVPAVVAAVVAALLVAAVVVSLAVGGDDPDAAAAATGGDDPSSASASAGGSSDLPDDQQVAAARAAAEAAIVPVLSYDYRHLPEDKAKALSYLTPAFAEEYGKIFDGLIDENSPSTRTVVQARLLASGISRTGKDRVDVVLFVDQVTTNRVVTADDPTVYKNQAIAQMVDTDGTWLLDCLVTEPGGGCDH